MTSEPEPAARSGPSLGAAVAAAFADLEPGAEVLVAVSGGSDSVALLHLALAVLPALGLRVAAAHLDHCLRPDSADDRQFVSDLSARLAIPLVAAASDVAAIARHRHRGLEEAARHARYDFLDRVAVERGCAAVALGHTRDDRAETLLLNLIRGAGSGGLSSMRERRGEHYRRPLLRTPRAALQAYLREIGGDYRVDPTNADQRLARNYLRAEVIPAIARLNPRVIDALERAARILADEDDYLTQHTGDLVSAGATGATGTTALIDLPGPLARRAALAMIRARCGDDAPLGHRHIDAVLALARGESGPGGVDLPNGWRARRQRGELLFERVPRTARPAPFSRLLTVPGLNDLPELGLRLRATAAGDEPRSAVGSTVHLPLARAVGMIVRSPRAGDRFRPLGGPGSRPLGRHLRDRGLSQTDRARVALLEQGGDILWVIGHQIGEAARVDAGSPSIRVEIVAREEPTR